MATQQTLRGSWVREGRRMLVEVRCGGRGQDMVGRAAIVRAKNGSVTYVTLTEVVEDFGANNVVWFGFQRIQA